MEFIGIAEILGSEYDRVLEASVVSVGEGALLSSALGKERPVIACLGGSVTSGYSTDGMIERCYPLLLSERLSALYGRKVAVHNLGTAGTDSVMGMAVTEARLAELSPDIVTVEFGVNEGLCPDGIRNFESLILKLRSLKPSPTIIIISVFNKSHYTCAEFMTAVARHYSLPAVELLPAMKPYLDSGALQWSDYSGDEVHPNADGQSFIADCILRSIKSSISAGGERSDADKPFFQPLYAESHFLDFPGNGFFNYNSEEFFGLGGLYRYSGEKLRTEFSAEFSALWFIYVQENDSSFGELMVAIDEEEAVALSGCSIFGWHNPVVAKIYGGSPSKHSVSIEMKNKSKKFTLAAMLICR